MTAKCQFASKSVIKPADRFIITHSTKSEEKFHKHYKDAPRKIFMRPPCEHEAPLPNPAIEINKACNYAVYTLKCRYYDELTARQLVAVERVIELQGSCDIHVETLHSFSTLLTSILSKITEHTDFALYEACLVELVKIVSRPVNISSLTASFFESDHIRDLYDAIGLFIAKSPPNLLHVYIPAVREIVNYIIADVVRESDAEFASCARQSFVRSTILSSIINAYDNICRDGTYSVFVLGIFNDLLEFLPDSAIVLLENEFVSPLVDLLDCVLCDVVEIILYREPVFVISGLLLQLCSVNREIHSNLIVQNFAQEKIVEIIYKTFQRYFLTVHDVDREIRNTFAVIIFVLFEIGVKSDAMANILNAYNIVEWFVQVATRPELTHENSDIGKLRLQMHAKDAALKRILLQTTIPALRLLPDIASELRMNIMKSLLFYMPPFASHKKTFWSAVDYEHNRIIGVQVLTVTYSYLAAEFRDLEGSQAVISLLRGMDGLDGEAYFVGNQELKAIFHAHPHLLLRKVLIRCIRTILQSEKTETETLTAFCIASEGIYALVQVLTATIQERASQDFGDSALIWCDILAVFNHVSKRDEVIRDSVRQLGIHALLSLMEIPIESTKPDGADVIRCIFAAAETWVVGSEAAEMQFIMGNGVDRLLKHFQESPPEVEKVLLSPLENILLKSFKITKYLEFLPHRQFLRSLSKLWQYTEVKPVIYSIQILLCSSWDKISDEEARLLQPIGNYMTDFFQENINFFLEKNDALKPWIAEEFRKLILLLRSGSNTGYSPSVERIIQNMGECSKCLLYVLERTHKELTANAPFDSNLFKQGVDQLESTAGPRILYARSNNCLFAESTGELNRAMLDA
ncbi:uncharacterized protein LOC129582007 [Paramacrobiotus metropolitanus]|uniref:uncharacterized protein LOC129582007 n=1 Tax=Paramacrobiotus metropolitanus TaxID=2943436 RepID=UPI00244634A6|nr:uncharacterized protein LOC129582007 [Paramacrobiotus metropolitanus]XP_055329344.1 uncharacterized protein LOC129582007 [Paramacrobiotus metropolitanus]XP_055329345.1 uncharacterized protein LOC129582007 [Paramacrobiotus metropolitanus]XP_055329346.1 uncharacterized protein LOC129582007 [Paramacrobiotus metropolitanus]